MYLVSEDHSAFETNLVDQSVPLDFYMMPQKTERIWFGERLELLTRTGGKVDGRRPGQQSGKQCEQYTAFGEWWVVRGSNST